MRIPPYRPDQGELISSTVSNVIMSQSGWAPDKALTAASGATAFPGAYRGSLTAVLPDGTFKNFAATATELYEMSATYGWGSGLSASLAIPDDDDLIMKQFGVFLIATNTVDGMMAYNMETPAGVNAIAAAPDARIIFPTNNLLVALDCDGNDRRLQTCNFGNFTDWTTGAALGKDFEDGEALTGGWDLGNRMAAVLQQNAVRIMTFGDAGGGAKFRVDKIADGVGAVHPRSVRGHNGKVYFYHGTGWQVTNGVEVKNIGAEKVNRWFAENCADVSKIYTEVDPQNTRLRIRYKSVNGASDTLFTDYLDYNWVLDEFIPGSQVTQAIFRASSPGYTLEGLDALGTLDALTFSLDSSAYQGDAPGLAGLDENGKFSFFSGQNLAATLETNTQAGLQRETINRATPLTDNAAATMQVGVKDRVADALTWSAAETIGDDGGVPLDGAGKFYRFRINHAAGATWTKTQAVEGVESTTGGLR